MLGKIVLVIIMAGVLAGAAATSTSIPVLVMGGSILFALSAAMRRKQ
jgi:hypothetical protein